MKKTKLLEKPNCQKSLKKKIDILNNSIYPKEMEFVFQNCLTTKIPNSADLYRKFKQTFKKKFNTNFSRLWKRRNIPQLILWGQHYPDTKTREGYYKKTINLQPSEHRFKYVQQNFSNLNTTIYKTVKTWSIDFCIKNATLVKYSNINQYNSPY